MNALTHAVSDRWTAWRAVLAGPWQRWIAAPFAVMTALQAIRDEVLPADLKEKLRLLRWLPDWPWYVWALVALGVFSLALLEGSYQFAKKIKDAKKPRSSQDERFNLLRQRVLHTTVSNDLPIELHALREFLIEQQLTRKPGFRDFFTRWLEGIPVVTGMRAVNVFTHQQLKELTEELQALELNSRWREGLGEALERQERN